MAAAAKKPGSFPPSRIKRIMQQDEDVGKLAQGAPNAVGKALELFVRDLVQAAAAQATSRGSSKVSMYHFKRAVLEDVNYDFLKEHVESIPDPVEKEKKQRKPRAPKDPSVSTSAGSAPTGSAPRKRKASAKAQQTTQQHFSAQNGVSLLQDEQDSEERRKSDEDFDFDAANRAADSGNDQESDSATSTPTVPSRMMPDEDEDYDA